MTPATTVVGLIHTVASHEATFARPHPQRRAGRRGPSGVRPGPARHGRRSGVDGSLATLDSTVGPTTRVVEAAVRRSGFDTTVRATVVPGAADARVAGDHARHDEAVRAALEAAARHADVVVLARVSRVGAMDGSRLGVPVLTSAESGVGELLAAARLAAHEL